MITLDDVVFKISADIKGAMAGIAKVETAVSRMDTGVGKSTASIRKSTLAIGKSFALLGTAAGAVTVGIGAMMIKQGSDMQGYMATLTQLEGSQEAAGKKMKWLTEFAKKTPFELPGLVEATTKLKAYGIDAEEVLQTLGDTAAVMGKPISQAVEALADAQTGEFERMKEFGIKAMVISKENAAQLGATAQQVGQTALAYTDKFGKQQTSIIDRNNREQVTSSIKAIWNEKYAGAMETKSKTMAGMISNIKDTLYQGTLSMIGFNIATGEFNPGGLFDKANAGIQSILEAVNKIDFEVLAGKVDVAISTIIKTISELYTELEPTFDNLKTIFESVIGIVKDMFASFKGGSVDVETLSSVINTLTGSLAKVFVWIDKHPQVTKLAVTLGLAAVAFAFILPVVTAVTGAIGALAAGFAAGGLAGVIGVVTTALPGLTAAIVALTGPIGLVILAVSLLGAAWATNLFGIRDKTASAMATIKYWIDSTKTVITNNIELIKTAMTLLLGPIGLVIIAFKNWDKIKEVVEKMTTAISDKMTGLATSAKDWGKNMITSFIDGIKSNFTGVTSAVKEAAGIVGDYLGFSSPTKEGPGKDVMKWGPNMVQAFAEGVSNNIGAINGAFGSLATPAFGARALSQMAGVPAPSQTTQINISFKDPVIRDEADIDKIVSKIEKQLVNNIRGVNII